MYKANYVVYEVLVLYEMLYGFWFISVAHWHSARWAWNRETVISRAWVQSPDPAE